MAGSDKRRRLRQSLVRWTDEEFNALAAKADKAGLAIAAFMRAAALGDAGPRAQRRPPADHKALRQILGELGRVGNNLNQIARALNAGEQARLPELKDALRAYMAIRDAIFEALGKKPGPVP
ncbi:MAG TPA: plasmid mobilization relaxosome protein MobC [Chloroflexota bacterium]|nr:plasmid mobilization relaxosome protein MobC [Chloroflexota bacterium]